MLRSRLVPCVLLALAAATLPGCPAFTSVMKFTGLSRPPRLELAEPVPQDFELIVHVVDQMDPPADYVLTFRRSGRCEYRVTTRAPKRRENSGGFEILDGQVRGLWEALRDVKYDELDDRYPSGDAIGPDKALGIQAFAVHGNELGKEVQAHFQRVPQLEKIRDLALSYLPEKAMKDTGSPATTGGKSRQIVGDAATRIFYAADDPRLKDVPPDRRQPFPSPYDALNFGYSPAPGYDPWKKQD